MLDITIEYDERVSPYVCYKCTRRLSSLEKAIEDRKEFRELAISSLNAQMKKITRVTSDTVRMRPSGKAFSDLERGLYLSVSTTKSYR